MDRIMAHAFNFPLRSHQFPIPGGNESFGPSSTARTMHHFHPWASHQLAMCADSMSTRLAQVRSAKPDLAEIEVTT